MELETLELRDHRYRAQKALGLLKEDQAEERTALEEQIAHYQEICPHEHAEEVEGEWRCRDCDLQKTTAVPEPEPAPETEAAPTAPAAETAPAKPEAAAAKPEAAAAEPEAGAPAAEAPEAATGPKPEPPSQSGD